MQRKKSFLFPIIAWTFGPVKGIGGEKGGIVGRNSIGKELGPCLRKRTTSPATRTARAARASRRSSARIPLSATRAACWATPATPTTAVSPGPDGPGLRQKPPKKIGGTAHHGRSRRSFLVWLRRSPRKLPGPGFVMPCPASRKCPRFPPTGQGAPHGRTAIPTNERQRPERRFPGLYNPIPNKDFSGKTRERTAPR